MTLLIHFLAAAVGTVAFALIFDVPSRFYPLCALIGGAGFWLADLLMGLSFSQTEATFIATLLVALSSRICSVWRRCPVTVFLISGIIPLVPGARVYWTAYYLVMGQTSNALTHGFVAIRVAVAIVLGIVLVLEIPNRLFHLKKPGTAGKAGTR